MRDRQRGGGLVAVHAHPDDESITMGATLARYAARLPVTVVTATLGEQGETMYGRMDGLDAQHADQLGGYRLAELDNACAALGVTDRLMLGGLGAFRDSGMAGEPSARRPRAFARAQQDGDLHEEAVAALVAVLEDRRPAVVLTYDETGGYGHPDHIAARQVTGAAFHRYVGRAAGGEYDACPSARLLEVVRPRAAVDAALDRMWRDALPGYTRPDLSELGTLVGDDEFDIAVEVGPWAGARRSAMAAHATQLDVWHAQVDGFALTNLKAQPLLTAEYFRVVAGAAIPAGAVDVTAGLPGAESAVR